MNPLDPIAIDRACARAAAHYDAHAVLQREVGARLLERLEYLRAPPARVLDLGGGSGRDAVELRRRYPRAEVLVLDRCTADAAARAPAPGLVATDAARVRRRRGVAAGGREHRPAGIEPAAAVGGRRRRGARRVPPGAASRRAAAALELRSRHPGRTARGLGRCRPGAARARLRPAGGAGRCPARRRVPRPGGGCRHFHGHVCGRPQAHARPARRRRDQRRPQSAARAHRQVAPRRRRCRLRTPASRRPAACHGRSHHRPGLRPRTRAAPARQPTATSPPSRSSPSAAAASAAEASSPRTPTLPPTRAHATRVIRTRPRQAPDVIPVPPHKHPPTSFPRKRESIVVLAPSSTYGRHPRPSPSSRRTPGSSSEAHQHAASGDVANSARCSRTNQPWMAG